MSSPLKTPFARRAAARLLRAHRRGSIDVGGDREHELAETLTQFVTMPRRRLITELWLAFGKAAAETEPADGERRAQDDELDRAVGFESNREPGTAGVWPPPKTPRAKSDR